MLYASGALARGGWTRPCKRSLFCWPLQVRSRVVCSLWAATRGSAAQQHSSSSLPPAVALWLPLSCTLTACPAVAGVAVADAGEALTSQAIRHPGQTAGMRPVQVCHSSGSTLALQSGATQAAGQEGRAHSPDSAETAFHYASRPQPSPPCRSPPFTAHAAASSPHSKHDQ